MEPSIAAMTGAAILMVVRHVNIVDILEHEIEWSTLIFFMMLFIIVAGAEETGLIQLIADWVNHLSRESSCGCYPGHSLGLGPGLGDHR